ncbi:MAG: Uma2 family endonuclease [Gemmataceae bacterium]
MSVMSPPPTQSLPETPLFEVVQGKFVALPPMGAFATRIATILAHSLFSFAEERMLGRVLVETLFLLDEKTKTKRRPDVAFVSYDRWAQDAEVPIDEGWNVIPNLAIEVVSPTNGGEDIITKKREYFAAGVESVWVLYPNAKEVHVFRSPTEVRIIDLSGILDGGEVLPGFQLPLARLFEKGRV